jgi:transcription-repair coupling factor (superfamily II helicase)
MSKAARSRRSATTCTWNCWSARSRRSSPASSADLERPLDAGPEVELHLPALIPEDYVPDVHLRLVLYKRIAGTPIARGARRAEGRIDRPLRPAAAVRAVAVPRDADQAARRRARHPQDRCRRHQRLRRFDEQNKIDAKRVLKLIQGRPKDYRLDGPLKLRFTHDARTEENLFTRIEMLVELLS